MQAWNVPLTGFHMYRYLRVCTSPSFFKVSFNSFTEQPFPVDGPVRLIDTVRTSSAVTLLSH